jgi:hydrophobic/amphiphilic exporter-1 (mainly G- bacteria), HAE1 family
MNFNFSAWSIRNPVPPILLFIVLVLVGIQSFRNLPITQFPNIDVPVVAVTVTQSGAAPAELESQVTKPIEDAIAGITGVKHITSTMADGASTTAVEFRLEVPTAKALEDVKDAVAKVRGSLPGGIDEPLVQRIDVEGQAIQTYAASAPGKTLEQLSWYVDDVVKRQLQGLPGVGRVERYGGVDREIRVDLDPAKLQSLGVTAANVNSQLNATNADYGAGRSEVGGREQAIRTLGGARSLEALKETKISLPGGRQVRLGEIASVTDSTAEPRTFARYNGNPVVTFSIFRAKGASSTSVGDRVAAKIAEMSKAPDAATFSLVDDTVYFIYGNYIAAMESLIEGALLAVIVVFLFLRDWRATLISAIALPLSALPAFWAMGMLGFSLNLVSFLGITLATGILVDDAIVEIENISRHMRMGKSPYRAALEAADEIGLAVIAITFTIIAVFVPVSFMGGIVGQYFKQFGLTVAVAVAFSLLVARLITPMMAAYLMRPTHDTEHQPGPLLRGYIHLLHFLNWAPTIKRKSIIDASGHEVKRNWQPRFMSYVTIVLAFLILVGSTMLIPLLPTGFIPPGDNSRFVLSVELPPGSRLKDTLVTAEGMAAQIRKNEEVSQVFVLGGSSPTGGLEARNASIFVNLKHRDVGLLTGLINPVVGLVNAKLGLGIPSIPVEGRVKPQSVIENEILPQLSTLPDVRWAKINDRGDREVQFNMLSNDPAALDEAIGKLEVALRKEPKLRAASAQGGLDRPEIKILPKTDEAAKLGITAQQISQAVRVATIGDFGPLLAKYNAGDRLLPIRVQIPEESRTDFSEISNLRMMTDTGASVPLSSVADVVFSRGPSSIKRFDRQRQASIGADIVPGVELGEASTRIQEIAKGLNLSKAVKISESGDAEIQGEVNTEFVKAAGLGVILMLVVLVLLLGNVFQPFAILLSLPLSIGGVVLALLATNNAFSMPVIIGMLMLIGIVAKNAIMLIDFAVERVKHGMPRLDAIVEAGRMRARPIVMTTIAMAAGMLPSAMGIGEGGSFRAPMAIAVIGGLIAATFLSLVFVPSFYIAMDDLARLTHWVFARFIGKTDEPETHDVRFEKLEGAVVGASSDIEELAAKIEEVEDKLKVVANQLPKPPKLKIAAE